MARPRLERKTGWIVALVAAQFVSLAGRWMSNPALQSAVFMVGCLATIAIGVMALRALSLSPTS